PQTPRHRDSGPPPPPTNTRTHKQRRKRHTPAVPRSTPHTMRLRVAALTDECTLARRLAIASPATGPGSAALRTTDGGTMSYSPSSPITPGSLTPTCSPDVCTGCHLALSQMRNLPRAAVKTISLR